MSHEQPGRWGGSGADAFVIHSLRHTFLTRLGETGMDVFNLMKVAGHSSVSMIQRYAHPTSDAMERGFEKMEALRGAPGPL